MEETPVDLRCLSCLGRALLHSNVTGLTAPPTSTASSAMDADQTALRRYQPSLAYLLISPLTIPLSPVRRTDHLCRICLYGQALRARELNACINRTALLEVKWVNSLQSHSTLVAQRQHPVAHNQMFQRLCSWITALQSHHRCRLQPVLFSALRPMPCQLNSRSRYIAIVATI